jgi:putative ABC transport system permease protein
MTRHILKLIWNRKWSTSLILTEILLCFLVLCAILVSTTNVYQQWNKPQGFNFHNVWGVQISGMYYGAGSDERKEYLQSQAELIRMIKSMPEVDSVATATNTPFSDSTWRDDTYLDGQPQAVLFTLTSSELPKVLELELLNGRWPNETDGALDYKAVIISRSLAEGIFGLDDPIGRDMPVYDSDGQLTTPVDDAQIRRIVGVVEDYSRHAFHKETPFQVLYPIDFNGTNFSNELLVRVQPGTTAEFEEQLLKTMEQIVPGWSYETRLLEDRRHDQLMEKVIPLLILAVTAIFLIIMVGLGLVGVLWQSVTRRTGELGLRRALGASANSVRMQILKELWALTALAVAAGTIIFLQFPLFGANLGASWPVILTGTAQAYVVIFVFVTFCGLYPTWLAMRIEPAAALNYE